jgi:hypothetical protein
MTVYSELTAWRSVQSNVDGNNIEKGPCSAWQGLKNHLIRDENYIEFYDNMLYGMCAPCTRIQRIQCIVYADVPSLAHPTTEIKPACMARIV